jgi:hypothetical protein
MTSRGTDTTDTSATALDPAKLHWKTCACGARYTPETWAKLDYLGLDEEENLEMRVCICGSTLAVIVAARVNP